MSYVAAVDAQSPHSHWQLGEASGNALDRKGVMNLAPSGGVTRGVRGLVVSNAGDGAITLNGSTGFLQSTATTTTYDTAAFTISGTVSSTVQASGTAQMIIENSGVFPDQHSGLSVDTTGKLTCYYQATSGAYPIATGTTVLVAGATYRCTVSHDGLVLRLFLNGVLDGSFTPIAADRTPKTTNAAHAFLVGKGTDSTRFFNGTIDEAQIFSTALTEAQDLAIYQAGLVPDVNAPTFQAIPFMR